MSASVNTADGGIPTVNEKGENATQGRTYGANTPSDNAPSRGEGYVNSPNESSVTDEGADTPLKTAVESEGVTADTEEGATVTGVGEDAPEAPSAESDGRAAEIDYGELMRRDLATLKATFPELAGLSDIADMRGALRYAALRDLGLTAEEAYMAASAPRVRRDNRAHLSAPVTRGASTAMVGMSQGELHAARELFGGMTDADIYNLYKRVSR